MDGWIDWGCMGLEKGDLEMDFFCSYSIFFAFVNFASIFLWIIGSFRQDESKTYKIIVETQIQKNFGVRS